MAIARVLVANRGEIALRVIKACRELGIESVVVVSEADKTSLPARNADRAVCIGPPRSAESYLKVEAIVAAALGTQSDAVHPGYGFLAEKPELAEACEKHGLKFIGPTPENIRQMGNKLAARELVSQYGVPVVPGSPNVGNLKEALSLAERVGYPLLLKAAAGGGGRGIKIVREKSELQSAFGTAAAEANASFGDGTLYIERFIPNARHIEVQVLGDQFGNVIHVGERDCSLQRRYQKVVEEALAYSIPDKLRKKIRSAAVAAAKNIRYENAGTVEFILDQEANEFYFLEMNTRIQVEHPVTEMITGVDLVKEQISIANGWRLSHKQSDIRFSGHAIECRITAEAPQHGFRPSPGRITEWQPPQGEGIRVDSHCFAGYSVPPFYDSLIAKLITRGTDREQAMEKMRRALETFRVKGIDTTIPFLLFLMDQPDYIGGNVNTRWVENKLEQFIL
ncbi:MAG TPA: acetyl-CoA carboxylase biotin carboxylase subunit [Candidatus Binatia bacterium]|jgi:acetyl-CoA carboxylase biotin carboxylase subunit|nr:acetyl-CoA carboxylase biotin carboxylase subunit [Candidatus Binatia bacterium]